MSSFWIKGSLILPRNNFILFSLLIIFSLVQPEAISAAAPESGKVAKSLEMTADAPENNFTADHSKFPALNQTFETGQDITNACLSCHNEADDQIHKTIHWTWLSPYDAEGKTGKAGYSINNFCISANKMEDTDCTTCHIGWNKKKEGINCLLCHSQKDIKWRDEFKDYAYFKESGDLDIANEIQGRIKEGAQHIGLPTRRNCGSCHFYGGGGEGVKHGDLDASLLDADKNLDIHMGNDSQNFQCIRCHTTIAHKIAGRVYSTPASMQRKSLVENDMVPKIMCESCHTATPHAKGSKMNDHTGKVACQTCHIPEFARKNSTEMWWDWSKAGKLKNGSPYIENDATGRPIYKSIKGSFKWEKNVVPEYYWYNGSIKTVMAGDKINPKETVRISWPVGSREDPNARIFPFKIHRGKQPYDIVNNIFLAPLLSPEENGYWKTFDWQDSSKRGMEIMGLPFSGKIGFVDTEYVFPTTHMVAPAKNALTCSECHVRSGGRMKNLAGFYMPGRDSFKLLDMLGWACVLAACAGVLLHGLGRLFTNGGKKEN